jgi:hypothetical protein
MDALAMDVLDIERKAACQAVKAYLNDYIKNIQKIQEDIRSDYRGIISTKLLDNPQLTKAERDVLLRLKGSLDTVISRAAARMEEHRIESYDQDSQNYKLNSYDRLRVDILVNSVRNINISIQKLKFAFLVLKYCNDDIRSDLKSCLLEKNFVDSKKLVLGNMLIIFELYNYLINFLMEFRLEGVDEIIVFSRKELNKIDSAMDTIQKLRSDANSSEIDAKVKEQVIENLKSREESLKKFLQEWNSYIEHIDGQEGVKNKVKRLMDQLPTMRLMRDNAENQLAFFEIMKIFGVMKISEVIEKNLKPLTIDPLPLDEIELISLPRQQVYALIGIPDEPDAGQDQ